MSRCCAIRSSSTTCDRTGIAACTSKRSHKVRDQAAKWGVEVLTADSGEFLIGDTPAVTPFSGSRP